MVARWCTLIFFTLSVLNPAFAFAQKSRKIASQKVSANPKKTPAKTISAGGKSKSKKQSAARRSEELTVQNQVSPDANGRITTTVVGAGGPGTFVPGAAATATNSSLSVSIAPSGAVATKTATGLPTSAARAAGESSPLLLGYTPAPPTPTPALVSSDTGMQMAAALAGLLGSMFGGGGNQNQQKQNPSAANAGYSGPQASTPASQPQSSATQSDSSGQDNSPVSKPNNESSENSNSTPSKKQDGAVDDPSTPGIPSPKPEETSKKAECEDSRKDETGGWQLPQRVDSIQLTMCARGEGDENKMPLVHKLTGFLDHTKGGAGVFLGSDSQEKIYPPKTGIIKSLDCGDAEDVCDITMEHKDCPDGAGNGSCESRFLNISVDKATKAKLTKHFEEQKPLSACQSIGTNSDFRGETRPEYKTANFMSKYLIYPVNQDDCALIPFKNFKDFDKLQKSDRRLPAHKDPAVYARLCEKDAGKILKGPKCDGGQQPLPAPRLPAHSGTTNNKGATK